MKTAPEKYRNLELSDASWGNNGMFQLPYDRDKNIWFNCMISDGMGWEHVSITLFRRVMLKKIPIDRCPTWEEMCFVKSVFWNDDEAVMQLHPPKKDWVSNHPYCLHLWRPTIETIPLPMSIMVGIPKLNSNENKTV